MTTGQIPQISVKGSDEFYPFMCSPCSRKDLDVGAEVYCLQCEEYFCGRCHNNHNSFAKMAAHTMLDRIQMEAKGPQPIHPLLTVPCDLHPGQVYTLFCEEHDQVCCAVCAPIHHKPCEVRYIHDVAKGVMQGASLDNFKQNMKEVQKELQKVKNKRKAEMQRLTEERDTEIEKIRKIVQQLIQELEVIEKSAVNEVNQKYAEFKTKIESDLSKLDMAVHTLNTKIDNLKKTNDETEEFIHMKTCKDNEFSARNLIEEIQAYPVEKLIFRMDAHVEKSIKELRSLGQMVQDDCTYSVTLKGRHRVDTKQDEKVSDINDICVVEDGTIIMTDWNNQSLKRLNQNFKVIDCLKFDGYIFSVCSVSEREVAVTLIFSKMVQFVTLDSVMSVTRSFKTSDRCRGIGYHADHLYVACGGLHGEGPSHIAVYTISGTLVWKFEMDNGQKLFSSVPLGVAVRSTDGVILVCDRDNGLVALGQNGHRLWDLTCLDLETTSASRVSVDYLGQAFVGSGMSGKVVLVSRNGRNLGEVLTASSHGINKLKAVHFDARKSRLIAGMENCNVIRAFKLDKTE